MKGVSYARFLTTLCLAGGFVKRMWLQGKANAVIDHTMRLAAHSQIGAAAKNSQPNPATFLSEIVQYWTAIYPKLGDHQCRT